MTVNQPTPTLSATVNIDANLNEAIMCNVALIEHLEGKWESTPTGRNEFALYQAKDNQARLIARRDAALAA